jgi:hypothetical protein
MAKVGKNIVTTGLSGKLGDLIVFRRRGAKTFVSSAPEKKAHELTPAQADHRKLFQEAILYGKGVLSDLALKAQYEASAEEGQSAYNVAVADFLNAPSIDEIDVSKYTGQVGSTITIRAVDDFMVVEVQVTINNSDGSLVESGAAVKQPNQLDWLYTATAQNGNVTGDKVVVRATDTPGNLSQAESTL